MAYEQYRPVIDVFLEGIECPECPHFRTKGEFETCDVINRKAAIEECVGTEKEPCLPKKN